MNGGTRGSICKNKVCAGQTRADTSRSSRLRGQKRNKDSIAFSSHPCTRYSLFSGPDFRRTLANRMIKRRGKRRLDEHVSGPGARTLEICMKIL